MIVDVLGHLDRAERHVLGQGSSYLFPYDLPEQLTKRDFKNCRVGLGGHACME